MENNFPRNPAHVIELQPVVSTTTLTSSTKARVVTKTTLVPSTTSVSDQHLSKQPVDIKSLVTTVVEISGQSCRIIKENNERKVSPDDSIGQC